MEFRVNAILKAVCAAVVLFLPASVFGVTHQADTSEGLLFEVGDFAVLSQVTLNADTGEALPCASEAYLDTASAPVIQITLRHSYLTYTVSRACSDIRVPVRITTSAPSNGTTTVANGSGMPSLVGGTGFGSSGTVSNSIPAVDNRRKIYVQNANGTVIVPVDDKLILNLAMSPHLALEMEPRDFEIVVGHCISALGFGDVTVTQAARDGGYDILMKWNAPLQSDLSFAVEVKRFSDPVPVKVVREFHSALTTSNVDRGLIVAASGFTSVAEEYALLCRPKITLISFANLIQQAVNRTFVA